MVETIVGVIVVVPCCIIAIGAAFINLEKKRNSKKME